MAETAPLRLEKELWALGFKYIGGLDEAGRGAWAGPVAAAVVVLPVDAGVSRPLSGVRDSKLMTPRQRERLAPIIKGQALAWGIGFSSSGEIDSQGILPATRQAMMRALEMLPLPPEYLLLDYIHWPGLAAPHRILPKGERHSLSIAAASVLAKTARDELMREMDAQYPGYEFARHKGYGTALHRSALNRKGPCEIHRRSFNIYMQKLENIHVP
jgi:ribonuclease HII